MHDQSRDLCIPFYRTIRTFAGLRPSSSSSDFIIEEALGHPGFILAASIESPGLASAPAVSLYIIDLLKKTLTFTEDPDAVMTRKAPVVLKELSAEDLTDVLNRALKSPKGFGSERIEISEDCVGMIAAFANGDARTALNTLEMVILNAETENGTIRVTKEDIEQCTSKKSLLYDKDGEEHYNLISALHKSMRNSDPDAAVYWLARMLEAGEEPLYVARRMIRFASEDVGLADSNALRVALNAYDAAHYIGMPECTVNLAHACVYLSMAPKSNALEVGYMKAKEDAEKMLAEPVPLHIRNAPTRLMKDLGYGEGYKYAHDFEGHITKMTCLPDSVKDNRYYEPSEEGMEAKIKQRLDAIRKWRNGK